MITQENIPYTADEIKAMVKTCEKYNKAIERMKSWAKGEHPECFSEAQKTAEFIFPELREDDDERVRKGLIKAVSRIFEGHKLFDTDVTREEALAWLEKQGEQKFSNIPSRETILAVWELGNDWKDLTKGVCSTEHGSQLKYIQNHWQESSYYDNIMEGGGRK